MNLKLEDVHIKEDVRNFYVTGKGNKFRITPISKQVTSMFKKYIALFHPETYGEEYLFYTMRNGIKIQMSADNVARFINKYEASARKSNPSLPHLHPHLFRYARALHLYRAGMPLPLVSEWLGHSQIETALIYANADTKMKRDAIVKATSTGNLIFKDEPFKFKNNEEVIKKLYGLSD